MTDVEQSFADRGVAVEHYCLKADRPLKNIYVDCNKLHMRGQLKQAIALYEYACVFYGPETVDYMFNKYDRMEAA